MSGSSPILIFACGNTLSHVAQAVAIAQDLEANGREAHLAFAADRVCWASKYFARCHQVPELWEHSAVPFPCLAWFAESARVATCLAAQEKLVRNLKPALVIGIFDFLAKVAARGIPFVSVNGGCMLPCYPRALGYADTVSAPARQQGATMDRFWRFAARHFEPALTRRGITAPRCANELLMGDRTLIYEMAELCGLSSLPNHCQAIGPIAWSGWERISEQPPDAHVHLPTVYLNAGTLAFHHECVQRLVAELMTLPVRLLASAGHGRTAGWPQSVFVRPFLSPQKATSGAVLVVCSGGIGTCYQNLASRVPSLVVPMHPEQAANGIHFEQQGCGRVMLPNLVFVGHPRQYAAAIDYSHVRATVIEMLEKRAAFGPALQRLGERLTAYDALRSVRQVVQELL